MWMIQEDSGVSIFEYVEKEMLVCMTYCQKVRGGVQED